MQKNWCQPCLFFLLCVLESQNTKDETIERHFAIKIPKKNKLELFVGNYMWLKLRLERFKMSLGPSNKLPMHFLVTSTTQTNKKFNYHTC
jgi:hypothetical protein